MAGSPGARLRVIRSKDVARSDNEALTELDPVRTRRGKSANPQGGSRTVIDGSPTQKKEGRSW